MMLLLTLNLYPNSKSINGICIRISNTTIITS